MKRDTIYLIIIAGFAAVTFITFDNYRWWKNRAKDAANITSEQNDVIRYLRDEHGYIIAEKNAAEATANEFRHAYPKITDELIKDFDVKIKNLKSFMRSEIEAQGHGNSTINNHYYTDSTGARQHAWEMNASDGYLRFMATVYDSLHAPYKYTYNDTITTIIHVKKKWFLGNEQLLSDSKLQNPNAKVVGTTNVLIKDYRDKRWVISAGVSYAPFIKQVQPTISFGYSLFKF